jgi:hypothetical protein
MWGYKTNYLHCHNRRQQLYTLLDSYNLKSTVNFPTRIINGSNTAIDNIFIDLSRNFTINPLINGLSDHDAQLLKLEKIIVPVWESTSCYIRNINSSTIYEFQCKLSMESWEDMFKRSDTNVIFKNFLNIYLKVFNACFTKSTRNSAHRYNPWITRGIKISCHNKRHLYMSCKESNDTNLKLRYKRYCKILTDVIKTSTKKKKYYDESIFKSKNKKKLHGEL